MEETLSAEEIQRVNGFGLGVGICGGYGFLGCYPEIQARRNVVLVHERSQPLTDEELSALKLLQQIYLECYGEEDEAEGLSIICSFNTVVIGKNEYCWYCKRLTWDRIEAFSSLDEIFHAVAPSRHLDRLLALGEISSPPSPPKPHLKTPFFG